MAKEILYTPKEFYEVPTIDTPSAWAGLEKIIPDIVIAFGIYRGDVIEFGVENGYSTTALANIFDRVVGVDTFKGDVHSGIHEDTFQSIKERLEPWKNIELYQFDYSAYQRSVPDPYDLAHVDIVHTYEDTFACGDWCMNHSPVTIFHDTESFPDVKRACEDLADKHGAFFYNFSAAPRARHPHLPEIVPMTLDMVFATLKWNGWEKCVESWREHVPSTAKWTDRVMENDKSGDSLIGSYEKAFRDSSADILGYVHDDVMCMEEYWYYRVMGEFDDPKVGMVGFGGAKRFGSPDLYVQPYELSQLGRSHFLSNMKNAEAHGDRFKDTCDVAVLDGFAMFIRRDILVATGGGHWEPVNYFCYDLWLSAVVRKLGYRTRLVGVACDHISGKTASMVQLQDSHLLAHQYIYDAFRGVLPFEAE